ncbi:lytic transglycosylase domain-containing protein [Candidatus Woesearchaeota archaeon]|nr:lytic transglycosylase domain-containing protein [Candidatus Woesearchaeota archaeon]
MVKFGRAMLASMGAGLALGFYVNLQYPGSVKAVADQVQKLFEESPAKTEAMEAPKTVSELDILVNESYQKLLGSKGTAAAVKRVNSYGDDIGEVCDTYNIPVELAKAIMFVESRGCHYRNCKNGDVLTSRAGAKGLMQLMPKTADSLDVDADDPEDNIKGGVKYLRRLFNKNKNLYETIAGYNAGPKGVAWAKEKCKNFPGNDFLKFKACLPNETEAYVPKVLAAIKLFK